MKDELAEIAKDLIIADYKGNLWPSVESLILAFIGKKKESLWNLGNGVNHNIVTAMNAWININRRPHTCPSNVWVYRNPYTHTYFDQYFLRESDTVS